MIELDPRSPLRLPDLFAIERWQHELAWQPFRERIEIHRLYGDGTAGASAVLLRYQPGGRVPWHEHVGHEHILVLAGSQRDESGTATTGATGATGPQATRKTAASIAAAVGLTAIGSFMIHP